MVTLMYNTYLC